MSLLTAKCIANVKQESGNVAKMIKYDIFSLFLNAEWRSVERSKIMEGFLKMTKSLELNMLHRLVKYLMKKSAVSLHCWGVTKTPMIASVELNNQQVARARLEGEESRSLSNKSRAVSLDLPLHIAEANNSMDTARLMLSYDANSVLCNSEDEGALNRRSDRAITDPVCSNDLLFRVGANERTNLEDYLDSIPAENAAALMYERRFEDFTALQLVMFKGHPVAIGNIVKFRMAKLKRAAWKVQGPVDELLLNLKQVNLHLSNLDDYSVDNKEPKADLIRSDVMYILDLALEFLSAYKRLVDGTLSEQPLLIILEECLEFYGSGKSAFTENERSVLVFCFN